MNDFWSKCDRSASVSLELTSQLQDFNWVKNADTRIVVRRHQVAAVFFQNFESGKASIQVNADWLEYKIQVLGDKKFTRN